jgi:hypothetical protein
MQTMADGVRLVASQVSKVEHLQATEQYSVYGTMPGT